MGGISEAKRAAWLPRAYAFAAKAGVRQMLHYPLFPTTSFPDYKSLLDQDGNPFPACLALESWVRGYQSRHP